MIPKIIFWYSWFASNLNKFQYLAKLTYVYIIYTYIYYPVFSGMSRDKKKSRWPITCQNHWHLEETDDLGPTLLTGAGLIWRINKKIDVRSRTFKRSVVVWYCWWNTSGKNQLITDMQFIPLFTGSVHPRWCRTSSINSKDRKERKSEFMWSIPNDISWTLWRWRGLKKTWFVKNDFKKKETVPAIL